MNTTQSVSIPINDHGVPRTALCCADVDTNARLRVDWLMQRLIVLRYLWNWQIRNDDRRASTCASP
jgi:hypothetical protein